MSRYLLAATPAQGHTAPMLAAARHLAGNGHEVAFLSSHHFADRVTATGARFVPLSPESDRHDQFVTDPRREGTGRRGLRGVRDDLRRIFIEPAPHQYHDLLEVLGSFPADAVLVDTTFVGVAPLVLHRGTGRPLAGIGGGQPPTPGVAMLGVLPLTVSSVDTAPFGTALLPRDTRLGRARNRALNWLVPNVALRDVQRYAQRLLTAEGCPPLERFVVDAPAHLVDAYLQATVEGFEYPRRDLPRAVRFIGPILPPPDRGFAPPGWWSELGDGRPVVHVTQGTLDNADLGRLVRPTIDALAGDDVLVVATTGGPDPTQLGTLPPNVRAERFVPHASLLGSVDVMVTNGGYGGVQQALAHGVPLVVAGDSEDKPEVAARVSWSGTGMDLRTGRPTAVRIGAAVRRVLAEGSFGERARSLQLEMASHDALAELEEELEDIAARRAR